MPHLGRECECECFFEECAGQPGPGGGKTAEPATDTVSTTDTESATDAESESDSGREWRSAER